MWKRSEPLHLLQSPSRRRRKPKRRLHLRPAAGSRGTDSLGDSRAPCAARFRLNAALVPTRTTGTRKRRVYGDADTVGVVAAVAVGGAGVGVGIAASPATKSLSGRRRDH